MAMIWGVKKYWDIDYILSLIIVFLVSGIIAQLGIGLLIESFMLVLPLILVLMIFYYSNIVLFFLVPTIVYIYTLLTSYAATIGLSYRAPLASLSIAVSIGRLVLTGKIPVTASYEPVPGLTVLYAISIISLILLIMDAKRIMGAGVSAFEDAMRVIVLALLVSLMLVYAVLIITRVYIVMWSITVTAIFIISFLAYRLLARDTR